MGRVSLSDILTFTRSTGGGRFNAQGQYEWVGPDVPRIDYDPVTGECKGLLIEEQRTNQIAISSSYVLQSNLFASGQTVAPDGSLVGIFVETDNGDTTLTKEIRLPSGATVVGNTYTQSFYLKSMGRTKVRYVSNLLQGNWATVDFDTVALAATVGMEGYTASIAPAGGGWVRCSITGPCQFARGASSGTTYFILRLYKGADAFYPGDGVSGVAIWGWQQEQGSFPTSYIPTNGAAVTRAADVPIAPIAPSGSWFNGISGAVIVGASSAHNLPSASVGRLFYLGYLGNRPAISVYRSSGIMGGQSLGGNTRVLTSQFTDQSLMRAGISYDRASDTSLFAVAGAVYDMGSAGLSEWSPLAALHIGRVGTGSTQQLNGHVQSVTYYPRALTDTELQELTKP